MLALTDIFNAIQTHWILSLVVILATLIYAHYVAYFGEIRKLGLPGPQPFPLVGNVPQMLFYDAGQMHITIDRMVKKYGKTFGMYFMKDPTVIITDPQMIKAVYVKEFTSFHDRPDGGFEFNEPMSSMLTTVTGERWKNIRNIVSPAFTTGKLKDVMHIMNGVVDTFLKKCKVAAESGETIDIYQWVQGVTMETILSAAFGIQSESQTNPDDVLTKYAKDSLKDQPFLYFLATIPIIGAKLAKYLMNTRFGFGFGNLVKVAEQIIKERKRLGIDNAPTRDILHLMLASQSPERKGYKLTDNDIVAQSIVFLLAGYETSSVTLGVISYHLAIYPEVQDKVQEEIDRIFPGDAIDYQSLHEMVYLDAVISETLRLYPPAIITNRKVTKSCEVNGVLFQKGMAALIPIYSLHRDEKYWDEPLKFKPERFLPENKDSIDPYVYLPFGQGPRNCVGMRFAMLEIKLVLVRMLKEYRVERAPELNVPIKMKQASISLLTPDQPICVQLKKRKE